MSGKAGTGLPQHLRVVNIGVKDFAETLSQIGAPHVHVDWSPPAGGSVEAIEILERLERHREWIEAANAEALDRILAAQPVALDVKPAHEVIPEMEGRLLMHAGPPVEWERMSGPLRGAVTGAILFEGWAETPQDAEKLAALGGVTFSPNHHHGAVGPMAGVLAPSMPLFVVENQAFGNQAYSNMNEGLGKVLRFGAYSDEVLQRLRWMRDVLGPTVGAAIRYADGIDLKAITARALQMGDEVHNRNVAGTSLFAKQLFSSLIGSGATGDALAETAKFLAENDHFFLNLSMAACKATMDAAHGIDGSSVVVAMCRNGTEFGIRLSGTGDEWFTAPAPKIDALYFPGYGPDDAALDIGDSTITETNGLGGFAMAAAPAIVKFIGGSAAEALNFTREMREITLGENTSYGIPNLDFAGTAVGIDAMKVVDLGIQPVINSGVAHKEAGVGQIGAGILRAPVEVFVKAVDRLATTLDGGNQP